MNGSKVGRYELGERIGSGALGTVYRSDGADGPVAVKVIHAALADRPGFRTRLLREAQLAQRVSGPGIVRVIDVDAASEVPYLVTEFIDAPTLATELATNGPLTGERLDRFAGSLMQAIAAIHRANVMHRDLKPTNVLVAADGSAHVVDFGLASLVERVGEAHDGRGTDGWMAPEVVAGNEPTVAVDVYGWGLLVAYAAAGHNVSVEAGSPDLGALPTALRASVATALDADPLRRRDAYVPASFPRADDVPPTDVPAPALARRSLGRRIGSGALVALIGAGAVYVVTRTSTNSAPTFAIYDDAFRNGTSLNQYNGVNDAFAKTTVHDGSLSVASSVSDGGVTFIALPDDVALSKFEQLRLFVRGDRTGDLSISITMTTELDHGAGQSKTVVINDRAWTEITVPVKLLVADGAAFDKARQRMLWLQVVDAVGLTGTLHYDTIELRTPS
jgi:serine/threonine protein kinase